MAEVDTDKLPTLPDSVVRKLDKGQDVRIEELREAALDDLRRGKQTPVRMDRAKPISHAEAAQRRTQQGEILPKMPAMRRVIPAPFQRPRIEIGHHGREWIACTAAELEAGDIVRDAGKVAAIEEIVLHRKMSDFVEREDLEQLVDLPELTLDSEVAVGTAIQVTNVVGDMHFFRPEDQVHAFKVTREPDAAYAVAGE